MVQNLQSMADKVDHIASLLESDMSQDGGPVGYSPNLLPIHFQLQQLEAFRNETMHQAKKSNAAEREILTRWFAKLDQVGEEFERWLWEISRNIVELARRDNGGTVVRLLKIIEFEGKEDEKVRRRMYLLRCADTRLWRCGSYARSRPAMRQANSSRCRRMRA